MHRLREQCNRLATMTRRDQEKAWRSLREGGLWRGCQQFVQADPNQALDELETCFKHLTGEPAQEVMSRFDADPDEGKRLSRAACRAVAAAAVAVLARSRPLAGDRTLLLRWAWRAALGGSADELPAVPAALWAQDAEPASVVRECFREVARKAPPSYEITLARVATLMLLGEHRPTARLTNVPLLLTVPTQQGERGLVARLTIEAVADGTGKTMPSPRMFNLFGAEWHKALDAVARAALRPRSEDFIWDLDVETAGVDGASAQGAFEVVLTLVSQRGLYDPDCAVSARVGADGRLLPVTGLVGPHGQPGPKLQAACEAGLKQVIVSPEDFEALGPARESLRKRGLEVVGLRTIGEAVDVASGLATAVRGYLKSLIELPDLEAPTFLARRRLSRLYVSPDVYRGKRCVPWAGERRTIRRAVVLGQSGEGKTLLAWMDVRALAEEGLSQLDAQSQGVRDINLPVYLPLPAALSAGTLAEAVRKAVRKAGGGEQMEEHALATLRTDRGWLFLDALDEAQGAAPLADLLEPLGDGPARAAAWRCRVLVTSRPDCYDPRSLPFAARAYRLAPLTPWQQRRFVGEWFQERPADRERFLNQIQEVPELGDLARNPLLLTFTCAVPNARGRVEVCRQILRRTLEGVWREPHERDGEAVDELEVNNLELLLPGIAWVLFQPNPDRSTFPHGEVRTAIQRGLADQGIPWTPEEVFDRLRRVGLLLKANGGAWTFSHRIFLKYLAADHLAGRETRLPLLDAHLWREQRELRRWEPAAADVLCLLAGRLDDPRLLLRRLLRRAEEKPDLCRTMLLLAGRALADANPTSPALAELAEEITDKLFELWLHPSPSLTAEDVLPALAHRPGVMRLCGALRTGGPMVRCQAARSLRTLGSAAAFDPLRTAALHDPDNEVRRLAVLALGAQPAEPALGVLVSILNDEASRPLHPPAAVALGSLGSPATLHPLIGALGREGRPRLRCAAAAALGRLGRERVPKSSQAIASLSECLAKDPDAGVRGQAAQALGMFPDAQGLKPLEAADGVETDPEVRRQVEWAVLRARGHDQSAAMLAEALRKHREVGHRRWAAEALRSLGTEQSIPALLEAIRDPDEKRAVRIPAAEALAALGCEAVTPLLLTSLRNRQKGRRAWAARMLGVVRSEEALAKLCEVLRDPDDVQLRRRAASALGALGSTSAVTPLIEATRDPDADVRREAVRALGTIGGGIAERHLGHVLGSHWDPALRRAAAEALRTAGGEESVPALRQAMKRDADDEVRRLAEAALGCVGRAKGLIIPPP